MKNKVKIGNLEINSRVSLAPMAGVTDYVLRNLIRKYSKTALITTEMISSEALINEAKCKKRDMIADNNLIKRDENHSPIAYQLTGHKPDLMQQAAKILEKHADIIDINMGCPVNKVVKGNDGSALMKTPELAAELVSAVRDAVSCPVSVKFRLGYTQDTMNFVEFGQKMQEAGASFITVHGRTRSQFYGGEANWKIMKNLTKNIDVPVFANGDVVSIETACECLEQSGADGVAIARGVLSDVTLIHRIEHYFETGEKLLALPVEENIAIMKELLNGEITLRGEEVGIKFSRKFYPYYINGFKNAAKLRGEIVTEDSYDKIINMLDSICGMFRPLVS